MKQYEVQWRDEDVIVEISTGEVIARCANVLKAIETCKSLNTERN